MVWNVNVSLPFYRWSIDAGREVSKNLKSRWLERGQRGCHNILVVDSESFHTGLVIMFNAWGHSDILLVLGREGCKGWNEIEIGGLDE